MEPTTKKDSTVEPQIIQLRNKKIIIKTKDKSTNIEFLIPDGVLEIIPAETCSPSPAESESLAAVTKKYQGSLKVLPSLNGNITPYQHPLQNQVILKNIGRYLSPADLAHARLTCKLWSNTLKFFQTVILSKNNIVAFLEHQSAGSLLEAGQFVKYYIHDMSFHSDEVCKLFKNHGMYMTLLQIHLRSSSTELNLDQFRNNILTSTPNLKEFHFLDSSGRGTFINKFWNQGPIFNAQFPRKIYLPRLKEIKFEVNKLNENYENAGFMIDFLNSTKNLELLSFISGSTYPLIRSNPNQAIISALNNKTSLEHFKALMLDFVPYNEILELIKLSERKTNQLQLKEFIFTMSNQASDGTISRDDISTRERFSLALNKLLQLQSESLKSLDVRDLHASNSTGFTLQLPIFPVLERFKLQIFGAGMKCSFDGGSILKNFPCLKIFDYTSTFNDESDDSEWEETLMTLSDPIPSVFQLNISLITNYQKLYRLSELFPNVTKLYVDAYSTKVIQCLWNKWPQLETLTIDSSIGFSEDNVEVSWIDECITGIPKEHHKSCLMLYKSESSIYSNTDDLLKEFKLRPGISELKYLSNLHVKSDITISDVSAYFGFIHPKSSPLNYLVIENTSNLSFDCQQVIHEKLGPHANVQLGGLTE